MPDAQQDPTNPPGWPGIPPRWTSSRKSGVGTALSVASRVWFTLSHGILNEIYYPRVDHACTRDFGLLVTDGTSYFAEEKRHAHHHVETLEDGVPAFVLRNVSVDGRWRIEKCILSDPKRDVVLQEIRFTTMHAERLRLFALLSPHLVNGGAHNTAWLGTYKGVPMLFAEGGPASLALACSRPWRARSVGYVGFSDGWQILRRDFALTREYTRAENGNVAMTGEIELAWNGAGEAEPFLLALAFGRNWSEAAHRARASLQEGFQPAREAYIESWHAWQRGLRPLDSDPEPGRRNAYRVSTVVLRTHESPSFPGGFIASLSIPWGFSKGDDDLGGYHLVWPRDLVETGGGLLAAGAHDEALRILEWLRTTQEEDGRWPQNTWLDGTAYWGGVQLDECAFPILLVDLARREGALADAALGVYWPMVRRAASFLVRNGPITGQDRWEEDGGWSPFTLAVTVAALLVAAELADLAEEGEVALHLRMTADCWNDEIECWTFATETELSRQLGVAGYYVRIAPPESADAASPVDGYVPIKNRPLSEAPRSAWQIVSPDALALVRFGLRAADDPRILDTVRVVDALLKVELPTGPCWRRYNGDGYGEHEDGRPFDGTGIGRPWPLLIGERAHYELAAGRLDEAQRLLRCFEHLASRGGLLPEQVWDGPAIPRRELTPGRPSGSAMPLVWAHAEDIKLRRSLSEQRVFDTPPQTLQRYVVERVRSGRRLWRSNSKAREMPAGRILRLELLQPALVHWSCDEWRTVTDTETVPTGLGLFVAELPTASLRPGERIVFTLMAIATQRWAGTDFEVRVR